MNPAETTETTESAYERLQAGIRSLCAEYKQVSADIVACQANLKLLPLAPVPLEDLKAGILEFIESSGREYGNKTIKSRISTFATGGMGDLSQDIAHYGKPLSFKDVEGSILGEHPTLSRAQLLNADAIYTDDRVLYFLFGDVVKEGLRRIMDDMTPAEFGYDKIDSTQIGTDRATRRKAIDDEQMRLDALVEQKSTIKAKLVRLGYRVEELEK